ncbi:hypothetical protein BROUX41_000073 [Berkeleyomyces rouxiae]|uniref:uncharacterized protein n=1 Tax=Berkeleyomyces rouxiae TaxID=2035830 RepID=UPI003B7F1273
MAEETTSKLPYSNLSCFRSNGIVFAVRGGQIVSFRESGGPSISKWTHPDQLKAAEPESAPPKRISADMEGSENTEDNQAGQENSERSTKRQRTEEPEAKGLESTGEPENTQDKAVEIPQSGASKEQKKSKKNKSQAVVKADRAIITLLSVTLDGRHVIAVSGHDKAVWVFEHDGKGVLTRSSKRTMPKRPCGITLAQEGRTIIVADKFGDVYALPLIPSDTVAKGPTLTLAVKHKRETPAATPLTVHSAGNLRALEAQKRHMAERQKQQEEEREQRRAAAAAAAVAGSDAPEAPMFEHSLVLGHVSMLADVLVARGVGEGQATHEFIITADRDEHIRVSRAPPQAYVVEGFCLAHKDFVSTLTIDESRPEILVSAGGDPEVFVWDWQRSELVGRTDLLAVAKKRFGVEKIAVSNMVAVGGQFFVVCEGIPAIFELTLDGNTLSTPSIISLPGKPLGITVAKDTHILVSVDGHGLVSLNKTADGTWESKTGGFEDATVDSDAADITAAESQKLFYTVETMRKRVSDFLASQEAEAEAEETPAIEG